MSRAKKHGNKNLAAGRSELFCIVIILLIGFALRSIYLDLKPVHFDEGINGNFVRDLWRDGFYRYNPENFHGPLYFYFLQLAELVFGPTIAGYRFINGLISLAGIGVIAAHRRYFGWPALLTAGMLAISPGSVFYSRYAIHESLFVLCLICFSFGYLLWLDEKSRRALAWMTCAFFASITVKETFFIFFLIWFIAVQVSRVIGRLTGEKHCVENKKPEVEFESTGLWRARATGNDKVIAVSLGAWFLLLVFTGGFLHHSGFRDMFTAFAFWTKTGTGASGHEKPFTYWIELLYRYETPALLGLVVSLPTIWISRDHRVRLIALVGVGSFLAYSLIPYKTPWLILNLLWPLMLTLSLGYRALRVFLRRLTKANGLRFAQVTSGVTLLSALVLSSVIMVRVNFKTFADEHEPYVYVQSTPQMKFVVDLILSQVERRPEDLNMKLSVLVRDPWPLPWLFGGFPNLIYSKAQDADLEHSAVVFIDGLNRSEVEKRLRGSFWRLPFKIRDSYDGGYAYLDFDKFGGLVAADSDHFVGSGEKGENR